ncbi:hypothetical protein [Halococcus sp. AFM35]|uniref:hypothetical protein n=1 Tax=Halococcus sp. AFM35 TaxID=3421653 RepID=UPI003EBF03EB
MSESEEGLNRKRVALVVIPLLALGLADVTLIILWGVNPLLGLAVLPPILFVTVLAWVALSGGLVEDRLDDSDDTA